MLPELHTIACTIRPIHSIHYLLIVFVACLSTEHGYCSCSSTPETALQMGHPFPSQQSGVASGALRSGPAQVFNMNDVCLCAFTRRLTLLSVLHPGSLLSACLVHFDCVDWASKPRSGRSSYIHLVEILFKHQMLRAIRPDQNVCTRGPVDQPAGRHRRLCEPSSTVRTTSCQLSAAI